MKTDHLRLAFWPSACKLSLPALYPDELTVPHARAVLEVNVAGEVAIADIGVLAELIELLHGIVKCDVNHAG